MGIVVLFSEPHHLVQLTQKSWLFWLLNGSWLCNFWPVISMYMHITSTVQCNWTKPYNLNIIISPNVWFKTIICMNIKHYDMCIKCVSYSGPCLMQGMIFVVSSYDWSPGRHVINTNTTFSPCLCVLNACGAKIPLVCLILIYSHTKNGSWIEAGSRCSLQRAGLLTTDTSLVLPQPAHCRFIQHAVEHINEVEWGWCCSAATKHEASKHDALLNKAFVVLNTPCIDSHTDANKALSAKLYQDGCFVSPNIFILFLLVLVCL